MTQHKSGARGEYYIIHERKNCMKCSPEKINRNNKNYAQVTY